MMEPLFADSFIPFGSSRYWLILLALIFCRSMDILSTRIATPNLVLEGNPIAKLLGWRWLLPINVAFCVTLAAWPLPAIMLGTMSLLVAARNFQSAWLMRSLGEEVYRAWHVQRIQETRVTLYLFCLAGETGLIAAIGAVIILFSDSVVLLGIGWGMVGYASAVAFYILLARWRLRRALIRRSRYDGMDNASLISVALPENPQPEGK
jgi:hypothetical protein